MSEPRPPATPPPVPADATGEWSSTERDGRAGDSPTLTGLPRERQAADNPTLTASGLSASADSIGIPNPFGRSGRYAIDRILGRGGMGAVFLAVDTQLERPVALKIPTFRGTISEGQKERFFREARAIAALRHPNICPVHDVDEENGTLYLTMSYIDGQTLATILRDGPMDQNRTAELIRRVALGMQAAHEHGTIHRDLKPANIMIDPAGEPVVMDFGLARRGEAEEEEFDVSAPLPTKAEVGLTQMGSVLGTPAYMPPEQAVGDLTSIGPQSDVYSLGAVFYECLTGKRPFDGPDTASVIQKILHLPPARPRQISEAIDPGLEKVCLKAMAKKPEDRYESMTDFAQAIKDVIDPELVVSEPPPLPPARKVIAKKKRRWVTPAIFISVTLVIVSICVGGPTIAIWLLIDKIRDTVKELTDSQDRSNVEWDLIRAHWQPPPEGADSNTLFPPTLSAGLSTTYRRTRVETPSPDPELGLTIPGQRAVYTGPNGETVSVSAYRSPEAQAQSIENTAHAFVQSVQSGRPGSGNRQKVVLTANTSNRTIDFGFTTANNQNHEYGKLWYSQGWLFHFSADSWQSINAFPSKYLLEVDKKASSIKTEKDKTSRVPAVKSD